MWRSLYQFVGIKQLDVQHSSASPYSQCVSMQFSPAKNSKDFKLISVIGFAVYILHVEHYPLYYFSLIPCTMPSRCDNCNINATFSYVTKPLHMYLKWSVRILKMKLVYIGLRNSLIQGRNDKRITEKLDIDPVIIIWSLHGHLLHLSVLYVHIFHYVDHH